MEEEERPRKLPKLGHDDTQNDESPDNGGPYMSGALLPDGNGSPAHNGEEDEFGDEDSGRDDDGETHSNADAPAALNTANYGEQSTQGLSRNQLRRLRRREQWEAGRDYRKAKRKEKLLQKRERKKAEREEAKHNPEAAAGLKQKNVERNRRSTLLPLTFVLDCGFDELMHEKERISLAAQLTRSYSDNSKAPYRAHMVVSSFDKLLKERFDTVLGKTHENWKGIRFMQEDFVHAAELAKDWMKEPPKGAVGAQMVGAFANHADATPEDGEIVYLSSDSPDTLTKLKPYSTYIIGGLVDKNRHKGICYRRAAERGIRTAKLPIGEYIQMAARSVLATNHVIEIMVRWLELGDWGEAFMKVIPKRKGGTLKQSAEDGKTTEGQKDGRDAGEPNSDDRTECGEDNAGPAEARTDA